MLELLSRLSVLKAIQGGMAVELALSDLAAAAANNGMIGNISAAGLGFEGRTAEGFFKANANALKKEIRRAREMSKGVIGVNLMFALSNFYELLSVCINEGVDVVFIGAGFCPDLGKYMLGKKTKAVVIVSSGKGARIICKRYWRDSKYLPAGVVVEGREAGGHLGFSLDDLNNPKLILENLLRDVLQEVEVYADQQPIPVMPAGGIYTGADIYRFLNLGAAGVQVASRFVTTHECAAHLNFKMAYIQAKKEEIIIIKSPVGMPGRAIRNKFLDEVAEGKWKPEGCVCGCIKTCDVVNSPYCIIEALINAKNGKLDAGFAFAGSNAYRAEKIISVKETVDAMLSEYEAEKQRVSLIQ